MQFIDLPVRYGREIADPDLESHEQPVSELEISDQHRSQSRKFDSRGPESSGLAGADEQGRSKRDPAPE